MCVGVLLRVDDFLVSFCKPSTLLYKIIVLQTEGQKLENILQMYPILMKYVRERMWRNIGSDLRRMFTKRKKCLHDDKIGHRINTYDTLTLEPTNEMLPAPSPTPPPPPHSILPFLRQSVLIFS